MANSIPVSVEFPALDKLPHGSFDQGFTAEWLPENGIAVFSLSVMTREAVEFTLNTVLAWMDAWPQGHQYLAIYESKMDSAVVSLSPSLREALRKVRHHRLDVSGYSAGVASMGMITHVVNLILRFDANTRRPVRMFTNRADAVEWLGKQHELATKWSAHT